MPRLRQRVQSNPWSIAPPRWEQYDDERIFGLYAEVAAGVDGPIIVQDFPPVNNVIMSADVLARIAEHIPPARYLKLEDPPLMQKISAIRARTDRFAIFGGLGSPLGAFLGALAIGIVSEMATLVIPPNYRIGIPLCVIALVLIFRPTGILGGFPFGQTHDQP